MSLSVAWSSLLSVVVVVDLLLTVALLRAVRGKSSPGPAAGRLVRPIPGTRISIEEAANLAPELREIVARGPVLIVLVVPGCTGCQRLRDEFNRIPAPPVPLVALCDPAGNVETGSEYLRSTWAIASVGAVVQESIFTSDALGRPDELPVVALVDDGLVVSSAHRLGDLLQVTDVRDWAGPGPAHSTLV